MRNVRVGLFGIGLDAYWPQFEGLKPRLEGCVQLVAERLRRPGVDVVDLGLIDTPPKALDAGHRFRAEDVDLIFLYVTTYALSSTVLPVVRRARVPVVVLNLQPAAAIDYSRVNAMRDRTAMTGEWLAHCSACSGPEIAHVFRRARPVHVLAHNPLGLIGHYYGGMLDIYTDLTRHCATFGGHVEIVELEELVALRREVGAEAGAGKVSAFAPA